jgi:hypothetical protein
MTDTELFRTEVAKVMTRAYPPLIMTLDDVAALLGMSYNHVRNSLQHEPGFPPKLDRFKQPRWSRDSILEWAQVSV